MYLNKTQRILQAHCQATQLVPHLREANAQTHLWLINVWFFTLTFMAQITTFAKSQNINTPFKNEPIHSKYTI